MRLADLLECLEYDLLAADGSRIGDADARRQALQTEVLDITNDSRKAVPGGLFFAIRGANSDGHCYAGQVTRARAAVLVVEEGVNVTAAGGAAAGEAKTTPMESAAKDALHAAAAESGSGQQGPGSFESANETSCGFGCTGPVQVLVPSTRRAMALLSAAWYGHPARRMKMIGITGTKGKTTTTYLVRSILERAGIDTGLIGTIEMTYHDVHRPAANTTPESIELQRDFREMADAGVQAVVMEVSSQALMLDRTAGIQYDIGVFTNLSEDHIGPNEHKDFEDYLRCKSLLFRQCDLAIVNGDDPYVDRILEGSTCRVERYGMRDPAESTVPESGGPAGAGAGAPAGTSGDAAAAAAAGKDPGSAADDLYAVNPGLVDKPGELGIRFDVKGAVDIPGCEVPTPGSFSIYNAMAAIAICRHFNVTPEGIREALLGARTKGRIELVKVSDVFTLMIDYAHNAAALESLLTTLREYHPHRLITLFGCGGNRSRSRRFEMGEVSGRLSDLTIITSDNPRFEEPMDIIADIVTGISKTDGQYITIPDRKEAIRWAIHHGEPGDIIVLAGKGHEDYQEIRGKKYPMDERLLIREILAEDGSSKA